ncbi:MAG: hypothetical protein MJK14_13935, partial [Rivularia sp. ALOHA_DT_140]|nr:hypothetical protein [Rivularia sp. ALOHA_DT_140]
VSFPKIFLNELTEFLFKYFSSRISDALVIINKSNLFPNFLINIFSLQILDYPLSGKLGVCFLLKSEIQY